jgi:hypothetical protein
MPSDSDLDPTGKSRRPPIEGEVVRRVAEFGPPGSPRIRPAPPLQHGYDQSFLRNPYVLAGIAVGAAIFLAVILVFAFGNKSSKLDSNEAPLIVEPLTPGPGRGVSARSVAAATVREGPGLDFLAIGELSRNQDIEIAGRNDEASWYNVYFPPGSSLRGWVPSSALRLPNNSAAIPVVSVTPIPRPTVIQPTAPPEPTGTPEGSVTPTATGTPAGGADLAASVVPGTCAVGARLIVNVKNNGPATVTSRAIAVLVQAADGSQRALAAQTATIPPGGQIDIDTTYVVQERVIATVDPLGTIGDPNVGNNRVDCVVAAVPTQIGPSPTRTLGLPAIPTATRTPGGLP